MKRRLPSLAEHVQDAVQRLHWTIASVIAVVLAATFAAMSASSRARSDQQILAALSPYLASLVESQDRPEILRVLQAVAQARGSALVLVKDGTVLASTRSISEIDLPYASPATSSIQFQGSRFSTQNILTQQPLPGGGATLHSFSPLQPTLFSIGHVILSTVLAAWIISRLVARKVRNTIRSAMKPMDRLHHEIQDLAHTKGTSFAPPILIIDELESMLHTISATKIDLANATDRLAEARAKDLSARSYKQLIHDLHNPAAALRQWATLLTDPTVEPHIKEEAAETVPRIADQILRQVSSAKKNLETEPAALRESDLRECVKASVRQLLADTGGKQVTISVPEHPVWAAHDPDLLQRALANLLQNGIEASKSRVDLSLECKDDYASIRICDDGAGMNEQTLSTYLQGQGKSSHADRGAIGLASANHIVRTHGGKIIYRRSPLGGASFEIRLEAFA